MASRLRTTDWKGVLFCFQLLFEALSYGVSALRFPVMTRMHPAHAAFIGPRTNVVLVRKTYFPANLPAVAGGTRENPDQALDVTKHFERNDPT